MEITHNAKEGFGKENSQIQTQANTGDFLNTTLTALDDISPLHPQSNPCSHELPATHLSSDSAREDTVYDSPNDGTIPGGSKPPDPQIGAGVPLVGSFDARDAGAHSHDQNPQ